MADIFREVDEEVRQDQALAFWNKYQDLIIAVAAIVVIAAGGWRYGEALLKAAYAADEKLQATSPCRARANRRRPRPPSPPVLGRPKGYAAIAQMRAAELYWDARRR